MSAVILRRADSDDVIGLSNMLEQSWFAHWGPHVSAKSRARFVREQPARGYVQGLWTDIIVAEDDGEVVGMYHLEGDYLHAIHVAPDRIGSGIGRALMEAAEAEGARRLDVRAFNTRALQFYAGRGWQESSRSEGSEMGTPVVTIMTLAPMPPRPSGA